MYAKFGKRVCDLVIGVVALPFVLLIIAVLAPFIHFEDTVSYTHLATWVRRRFCATWPRTPTRWTTTRWRRS